MRVLHVASSLSRNIGGPARSVQGLVAGLQTSGVETYLLVMKPYGDPWVSGIKHYRNAGCTTWFGMQKAVEKAIDDCRPDIVHIHSIWQWTLHLAVRAARKKGIPYIIAPRGTVEEWSLKQKWLKKKIALWTYQGSDLRHAAAFHVTAESEGRQLRKLGYQQPLIFSPNGVNVPKEGVGIREWGVGSGKKRALFVSRMHPKKGVLELVEAFAKVKDKGEGERWCVELVYTVNGEVERAYEQKVKNRILALGMSYQDKGGTVHCTTTTSNYDFIFTGPLDDEKKWEAYARADLFVLPSFSENFGIVVAEALYAGIPVITTKGAPWADLIDRKCGWWVPVGDVAALADAIRSATTSMDAQLSEMGARGRQLVDEKYSWIRIAERMKIAYQDLI